MPIIVWVGSSFDIDYEASIKFKDVTNSHDAVAQTILSVMEVESDAKFIDSPPLIKLKAE